MVKEKLKIKQEQEPVYDETCYKKRLIFSFSLFFIFATVYFLAAVITSFEFRTIAAICIFGLPLAFHLGLLVFIVGVVVTRFYLMKT